MARVALHRPPTAWVAAVLTLATASCNSPAEEAYSACVNAEAEADYELATAECKRAEELDPDGPAGKKATIKLASLTARAAPSASGDATGMEPPAPTTSANRKATAVESYTRWIQVMSGVDELGVIEIHPGDKSVLTLSGEGERFDQLKAAHDKIAAQDALALDMHLEPEKPGERGAYGTVGFSPSDPNYYQAVMAKLSEADFNNREIPNLDVAPPAGIVKLTVGRGKAPVGTISFREGKPVLKLHTEDGDALLLAGDLAELEKREQLHVRYVIGAGKARSLVTINAKKTDSSYPHALAVALFIHRQWQVEPSASP